MAALAAASADVAYNPFGTAYRHRNLYPGCSLLPAMSTMLQRIRLLFMEGLPKRGRQERRGEREVGRGFVSASKEMEESGGRTSQSKVFLLCFLFLRNEEKPCYDRQCSSGTGYGLCKKPTAVASGLLPWPFGLHAAGWVYKIIHKQSKQAKAPRFMPLG